MPKLGQHFLVDKQILQKIIKAANIKKTDIILEIGPGKGVLTREIANRAKRVIAVELDKKLTQSLKIPKTKVLVKDILEISELEIRNFNINKIIANIPYYITGKILRKFTGYFSIYLLQKEVADRIVAKKHSLLSLCVRQHAKAKIISYVPKTAFKPVPKVDSAIIKLVPRKKIYKLDFNLIKKAFSQKRKKLRNTINIDSDARPEDLSLKQWEELSTNR